VFPCTPPTPFPDYFTNPIRVGKVQVISMGDKPTSSRPEKRDNTTAFDRFLIAAARGDFELSISLAVPVFEFTDQPIVCKVLTVDRYFIEVHTASLKSVWFNKAFLAGVTRVA
jgi:hypothetical protein